VKEVDLIPLKYEDFLLEVNTLREKLKAGTLFRQDTRDDLQSALNSIEQSIGGSPIYASAELKAAIFYI